MRTEVIGNATLYLADCAEVMPLLQPVDLLLTDPPYGIGESSKNHKSRNRVRGGKQILSTDYGSDEWDEEPPSASQLAACVAMAKNAILWGGNYFGLSAASKWLVWDKNNGENDFADCELAWTNLPGAVRIFRHMWNGMLRASERNAPRVHPTQKPVALMDWCIGDDRQWDKTSLVAIMHERDRLKAALREIASREDEARDIVQCNRWPSTLAIDLAGKARLAIAEPETNSRNQAEGVPSDTILRAPTPRGSLPNSLGASECVHPMNLVNNHGSVTGNPYDFRCTVCDTILTYSLKQAEQWQEIKRGLQAARDCARMSAPTGDSDGK